MPVIVGRGGRGSPSFVSVGITTSELKQIPRPGTTEDPPEQLASTHCPPRTTWLGLWQERQEEAEAPVQLPQLPSQALHSPLCASKNWFLLHVGKHRPPEVDPAGAESTGREDGQERHWEKEDPEQEVPQSGWQGVHVLRGGVVAEEEEKEAGGQDWTHWPAKAKREPGQEVQNVEVPAQVAQDPSQAAKIFVSC
jgi:hypothetical protein